MASSKFYNEEVPVPKHIIMLAERKPEIVFCNFRLDQRPKPRTPDEEKYASLARFSAAQVIHYDIARFLRGISRLTTVAILYQDYGSEISSIVTVLPPIECWSDGIPRLDFEKPHNWNHCPNFWGTFILAIAWVNHTVTSVISDPGSNEFFVIADACGIPATLPPQSSPSKQ